MCNRESSLQTSRPTHPPLVCDGETPASLGVQTRAVIARVAKPSPA
ncbi:hypothetical protein [Cupriavidus sp. TMH.W2]